MQDAEFEEKDFEAALYHQLAAGSPNLWTPGQVFEHHFGIDAALKTSQRTFLNSVGHTHFPRVLILEDLAWGYVWRSYGRKHGLPSFEVNALLQAKRPTHLKGRNRAVAHAGISGEYWRFKINHDQQRLLEKLQQKVGRRAVVSYACPAFHLWHDLDAHIAAGTLPDSCSYVKPSAMRGHRHWCFNVPGGYGVACSEPEIVNGSTFLNLVRENMPEEQSDTTPSEEAGRNLFYLASAVEASIAEESEEGSGLARAIARRIEQLGQLFGADDAGLAFAAIATFASMVGLHWYVVGKESTAEG